MQRHKEQVESHCQFLFAMFSAVSTLPCIIRQAKNLLLTSEAALQMIGAGKEVILP
jgi:xanthine/uracil permease